MPDGDYSNIGPGQYDQYIAGIMAQLQEAAGSDDAYRTKALEAQMQSAEAARANALRIAQLQSETSRYGVDAQRETEIQKLKENARQFDAQHGLEIAKAYTAFASTPDLMFARNDFVSAMGRVGQGLSPQSAITRQPGPQAKTFADFDALTQYRGQSANTFAAGGSGNGSTGNGGGGSSAAASAGTQSANPPDPRLKAAGVIAQAIPPSETPGADDNDWAAINAIRSLYQAGRPGIQKLGPARQKIALAGLARAGFDPAVVQEEYLRGLPGQGSPLLSA